MRTTALVIGGNGFDGQERGPLRSAASGGRSARHRRPALVLRAERDSRGDAHCRRLRGPVRPDEGRQEAAGATEEAGEAAAGGGHPAGPEGARPAGADARTGAAGATRTAAGGGTAGARAPAAAPTA